MRFKSHLKLEYGLRPIDIAPLINIIFLLFIFLFFSSSLVSRSEILVKLPKTFISGIMKETSTVITITSEDVAYLNGNLVTTKELKNSLLKNKGKSESILIKANRRASLGRILDAWNICRELGIENINITSD